MKRYIIFILFLIANDAIAQNALHLQHLNVEDGLSQSSVYSIFQDSHGFMWFATGDGLNRYDGKGFLPYKSKFSDAVSSHLTNRNINSRLFEDKNNILWFATDPGISFLDWRYTTSGIVIDKFKNHNAPTVLGLDGDLLWSIVPQSGFYALNINDKKFKVYAVSDKCQTESDTVCIVKNGVLTAQGIWVADRAGLLYFDKVTHHDQRVMANGNISSVLPLADGTLLLTAKDGVYFFDTTKKRADFFPIRNYTTHLPLLWNCAIEEHQTGTIYLGAANSGTICKIIRQGASKRYEFINFQKSNINCLYIDRSQNLWIGTEGKGAYRMDLKPPKFCSYIPNITTNPEEAEGFMVKSIFQNDSGSTWIGTYDKGLSLVNLATNQQRNIALPFPVEGQLISSIFKDSSGNIVAAISDKILWLDEVTGKIKCQLSLPQVTTLSTQAPKIYCVTEWKKGHYLAGTNLGMYTVKNESGHATVYPQYAFKNSASLNTWIYNLSKDKSGVVYVGKRSGFVKMNIVSDTAFKIVDEGFPGIVVRHFYKSTQTPILWLATEKGLIAYNEVTKHYKVFDETNGLANSSVYAILPQTDQALWISTNHGLSDLAVDYGKDTGLKVQFINYTAKDGLQSNEFNSGAYYQSGDGTLFFGGIAGINWFNPGRIKPNTHKALPAIADIFINEHLFAGDTSVFVHKIVVPYDQNTISFSVRSLEFTQPDQNLFAYKLDGLDKNWVYTANDKIRYSTLPAGNYSFLLKVSNNEGIWNEEPLKIELVILPPYWATWWFRLLIIMALAFATLAIIRAYVKQRIKAKTREHEKQQALYMERLRISKDMHDDIGSGLSKISLMAEMAQKKVAGNPNIGNDIQYISAVSKDLVDNMRDLIWVLNPENTSLEQFAVRLREYCADYLENMPLQLILDFPDTVPPMPISGGVLRNVFLTTKEAINNCVKHSLATEIKISLCVGNDKLMLSVWDNGHGFDIENKLGSGNGLRNMKQRIELIGGSFSITSMEGSTKVVIEIPFANLSENRILL